MIIQLNGKSADIPEEIVTLQDLLVWYGLKDRIVIAELNREIIDKENYQSTTLVNRDILELIHFVGGG
ncbi:sulfur carrier protein ThiS [Niallia taxi]|uniref:Sulfur carrier protein ThiS n=2 Tax=Niallia TaxID=2837506 RepID=A0A437K703_9BACI|nr:MULTISPECIES: sulfur carrier protein ThiS [Niallia]MCM3217401.1 sulfur carrier protein ThiS [Niallia taxi]MDK8641404.1 sulfur carrier protein ThiS [Niallia taxi]MED4039458.1 sulfur carrier protein ThiS [Niallia taxi]MED4055728.1 sulfur carrier protein ThiS [Niallia taxi]MED4121390.1 sulfur carrier protein ThiS [Niallia taxi]